MEFAMATAAKTVYSHVTKQPGVRGGRPCIDDTRVAVVDIVAMLKQHNSAEQMLLAYPSLNLAQIHAAISYYYENQKEIEAELAEDDGWEEEHYARMSARDFLEAFEDLARQPEDPFRFYPIIHIKPKR
jgi:uncharacterized protein (DUF433 family)